MDDQLVAFLSFGRKSRMVKSKWLWLFVATLCLIELPMEVCAGSCAPPSDWRNINVLPTNGDAGANIKITLQADKTDVKAGERIVLTFQADHECYLTIMNIGTSGKVIRLWPNSYSTLENRIPANTPRRFPNADDGFAYKIGGPPGVERVIAYATSEKGKILDENEFTQLGQTGFRQFKGASKDLAVVFQSNAERLPAHVKWGTAQINLCIDPEPQPTRESSVSPARETPGEGETPKRLYCLAVGVSLGKLKYCEDDTKKFMDVVKGRLGAQDADVRMLLGKEASHAGFVEGMKWLATRTRPQDSAIIYFNGHGSSIPDQPPRDEADGRDEAFVLYHDEGKQYTWREAVKKKFIMVDDEFDVLMQKIPARNKILIADACHSGTLSKEPDSEGEELVSKYYPLLDPDTGEELKPLKAKAVPTHYSSGNEACMAACLDNQSSYESPRLKSSLFTHYLLQAIDGGARDLQSAFNTSRVQTIKYCEEASRKGRNRSMLQTPSLADPHGLTQFLKFSK
jgi:hypothetical protein